MGGADKNSDYRRDLKFKRGAKQFPWHQKQNLKLLRQNFLTDWNFSGWKLATFLLC